MIKQLRILTGWFAADQWPSMTCPHCGEATLRADPPQEHESVASKDLHGHEAWEPEWTRGFFTVTLHCQNSSCREMAVAVGDWCVEETYDRNEGLSYQSKFRLRSCVPAIPIIDIPSGCPDPVKEALSQAAQVIWIDPGAAGNRLRFAIERVLDDRKVARTTLSKGKRVRLTLHARIDLLRAKNKAAAEVLEAVKWIGNQASHEDSVTIDGALEAAQILEHALVLIYDRSPEEIRRRVRKINKDKRLRPSGK